MHKHAVTSTGNYLHYTSSHGIEDRYTTNKQDVEITLYKNRIIIVPVSKLHR